MQVVARTKEGGVSDTTTTVQTFESMLGVVMTSVTISIKDADVMVFAADGREWRFFHERDCCEQVRIEDICGDLGDLVGSPIVLAEEVHNEPPEGHVPEDESETWTFYRFATAKGYVTVRWLGSSNGYYSESVSFEEVTAPK